MMHKSPILFRLTADCTLELPPTRTISLTQCCFRDDPNRDLSKDFCRFHHLEPAEVNILSETPIWYPKPIILAKTTQTTIPLSKFAHLRHDEPTVTPIFFKHLLANFKDYLTKIQESFMSCEESRQSYISERSTTTRSRTSTPEPSQSVARQSAARQSATRQSAARQSAARQSATASSQRGSFSIRDSGWPQSLAAGLPRISPTKITEFVKSVWHGFEVMGLTEDNTVG